MAQVQFPAFLNIIFSNQNDDKMKKNIEDQ